jgi:hypothetical protein
MSILIAVTNCAEIGHHKLRHHAKLHKKSSTHHNRDRDAEHDDQMKRTVPPNIWALLEANSLASRNQTNDDGTKYSSNTDDDQTHRNSISDLDFDQRNTVDESVNKVSANCPKCKQNSVKMSEDELTNLRIEYVKNQILHKLGLNERPPPKSLDDLPEPIQEGYAIQSDDDTDYLNRHLDDYFAKTTQKIIFLTQGKCAQKINREFSDTN